MYRQQHHGITPDHTVKQETKVLRPGSDSDNQLKFALELLNLAQDRFDLPGDLRMPSCAVAHRPAKAPHGK